MNRDVHDDEPHRVWERECNRAVDSVLDAEFEAQGLLAIAKARRLLVVALRLSGRACEHCQGHGLLAAKANPYLAASVGLMTRTCPWYGKQDGLRWSDNPWVWVVRWRAEDILVGDAARMEVAQ